MGLENIITQYRAVVSASVITGVLVDFTSVLMFQISSSSECL